MNPILVFPRCGAARLLACAIALSFGANVAAEDARLPRADAATAGPTDQQILLQMLQRQAEEIALLKQRLEAIEQRNAAPAPASAAALPLIANAGPNVAAPQASPTSELRVDWSDGAPLFFSGDKYYSFRPRMRVLMDFDSTSGSAYQQRNQATTGSRVVRFGMAGSYGSHVFYQMDIDWAENQVDILSAYLGWRDTAFGHDYDVRVGNVFNDRSIDGTSGSDSTIFMERNVVANALIPLHGYFGNGVSTRVYGSNWHASLTFSGDDVDSSYRARDTWVTMARFHWNPVKTANGTLHVGAWGFNESIAPDAATFSQNLMIGGRFNGNLRVQSGAIENADSSQAYGGELALIYRSFYAWGEIGQRRIEFQPASSAGHFDTDAWSVAVGYMLTGDKTPYSARTGIFDTPVVKQTIFNDGIGAIALLARYEHIDYRDLASGGDGNALTLGATWYPAPWIRFMANWTRWQTDNRSGSFTGEDDGDSITLRSQISF